jgi:hypothetical protein
MNRNRRLSMVGATLAGLIGVTALTGAAAASADPGTATRTTQPTVSVPAQPVDQAQPVAKVVPPAAPTTPAGQSRPIGTAQPGPQPAPPAGSAAQPQPIHQSQQARSSSRYDRTLAKVKAAVLQAYPNATITSVTARDGGGWTVSVVTQSGRKGIVIVNGSFSVSRLIVTQPRHRQAS